MMVVCSAVIGAAAARQGSQPPRTPWGTPDFRGTWSNATITRVERPPGAPAVLPPQLAAEIEEARQRQWSDQLAPSDADRGPPESGDQDPFAAEAQGGTGGYNIFWFEQGDRLMRWQGRYRSSIVSRPEDGRVPPFTEAALARQDSMSLSHRGLGQFDNPEGRPLGERCLMSFGFNAGPPMLPNYFYNNYYMIVQTPDHVAIMTEMVHDTRIISLGEGDPFADHVRPWMGDSRGRWEGDTLVVETTNINPAQLNDSRWFRGASGGFRVTERFTRPGADVINYEFTVDDPDTYAGPWGGEVVFEASAQRIYEYACHEGNYGLANVLQGARAQERTGTGSQPDSQRENEN